MKLFGPNHLLPATAAVIAAATLFKVGALVTSVPALDDLQAQAVGAALVARNTGSSMLPQAQAAGLPNTTAPAVAKAAAPGAATPAVAAPAAMPAAQPAPAGLLPTGPALPDPAAPAPAAVTASANFVAPTDADKALLEDLRTRRSTIETREQRLAQREATMAAAEQRLTARVGELGALQVRLQGLQKNLQARDDANWGEMVKLYEAMRPRDAAAIFNVLDKSVLIEVLDRMKPAKAAPVLAAMDTEKARQATADLATRRTQSTTLTN